MKKSKISVINSAKTNLVKALPPHENSSIFKCKIYFVPAEGYRGETTQWSFDYASERQMFENEMQKEFFKKMVKERPEDFKQFNGYRKMLIFLEKLSNQGKLKTGIIYLNLVYDQTSVTGEFMPMELVRVTPNYF